MAGATGIRSSGPPILTPAENGARSGNIPMEWNVESKGGNGLSYTLHGLRSPASLRYPGLDGSTDPPVFTDPVYGASSHSVDKESYGQLNTLLKINSGSLESIKLGARFDSL